MNNKTVRLRPLSLISENICFQFSVYCLCSGVGGRCAATFCSNTLLQYLRAMITTCLRGRLENGEGGDNILWFPHLSAADSYDY